MMQHTKRYIIHFIFLIVALQILNMSVSGRVGDDVNAARIDDSVNIADHALEFVVENVLGFPNAFPEKKEIKARHSASCCQKVQAVSLFSVHPSIISHPVLITLTYSTLPVINYNGYLLEIAHPPPKLAYTASPFHYERSFIC